MFSFYWISISKLSESQRLLEKHTHSVSIYIVQEGEEQKRQEQKQREIELFDKSAHGLLPTTLKDQLVAMRGKGMIP